MLLVLDGQVGLIAIHALRAMYNLVETNDAKQSISPPGVFPNKIMHPVSMYDITMEGRGGFLPGW